MATKANEGITIEFTADTVTFDKSINNVNKSLKILKQEYTNLKRDIKRTPTDNGTYSQMLKNVRQQISLTKDSLSMLKGEMNSLKDANGKVADENVNQYASMSKAYLQAENALKGLENREKSILSGLYTQIAQWKVYGNTLKTIGEQVESLGRSLSGVSLVSAGTLVGAAKSAMDFESAMTGVYKTVDETARTSYEDLAASVREMAETVPSSQTEIASVMEMAGQLGVSADNIVEFTKVMIDLGNATNLTATDGAKAIAQFYNIMEEDLSTVDRFGSTITQLGNNSATTEEDIMYMAKALAAAGHQVGMSSADVLGLATSLASVGLSAERGGSSFSTIMRKIDTDAKTVSEASTERLAVWGQLTGQSAEEFRASWNSDVTGTLKEVMRGLSDTSNLGVSLYQVLDDVDISNIRQVDTMTRLANAYENFDTYMAMANEEWNTNTALTKEANRRYETTESQISILKNKVVDIGITLGDTLLPIINDLIDDAEPLLDSINRFVKANGQGIVKTLAFTAALYPLLTITGKVTSGIGGLILNVTKYQKIALESTGVTSKLATLLSSGSKFGLYGAAAAAAVGIGSLIYAFVKSKDEAGNFRKEIQNMTADLEEANASAETEYLTRLKQIDSAGQYVDTLQELNDKISDSTLSEEEAASVREQLEQAVNDINTALGEEIYGIDEETGKLTENGEVVDDVKKSYDELTQSMRQQAWLDVHYDAYTQALKDQQTMLDEMNQKVTDYNNKLASIKVGNMEIGTSIASEVDRYLSGETTTMQGITDAIKANKDMINDLMAYYGTSSPDIAALEAATLIVINATSAQRKLHSELDSTAQGFYNAQQTISQYEQVAAASPAAAATLINSALTSAGAIYTEAGSFGSLRDRIQEARDLLASQGATEEELAPYDEMLASMGEVADTDDLVTKQKKDNAASYNTFLTDSSGETNATLNSMNQAMNNTMLANNTAMANQSGKNLLAAGNKAMDAIDRRRLQPKTLDVYVVYHNVGGGGGSGGYGGGSGGYGERNNDYQSGGFNINVYNSFAFADNSSASMRIAAMQAVDTIDTELGKRLGKNWKERLANG